MSEQQHIAKAERTWIGMEDHGIFSATIGFNYGGSGQSLPLRCFGSWSDPDLASPGGRLGFAMAADYLRRLMLAFGVTSWDAIKGRTVLVTATYSDILRIDPLPTEAGTPFDIADWAASWRDCE